MFLAGDNAGARDAVHVFAAEKVRPDYFEPAPDTTESEATESFRLLSPSALTLYQPPCCSFTLEELIRGRSTRSP